MILEGKKTYLGIIVMAIGEAFVVVEGLPDELGQTLKFLGGILALVGRYLAGK